VSAAAETPQSDPCLAKARHSLAWYSYHAWRARLAYQILEVFQIGTGAAIPLAAALHWPIGVGATLGACIALAGGIRSVFRWQANWVQWSITASKIQREMSLYEVQAPPYNVANRGQLLVQTVAELGVAETLQWASQAQQTGDRTPGAAA
jgi:hypothetical protein